VTVSDAIRAKSDRLLTSGRVVVTCSEDGVTATVEGDHGRYTLIRAGGSWLCPCPARRKCSHAFAVERVTT
jgi:hypothetical protein